MQWYEDDVKQLEINKAKLQYEPETLFYGSSTIRLWESLYEDFENLKPINLGFGGSTLAACVWFFNRIMVGFNPKRLIVYAGDNDLGDGRNPEEVFISFEQLVVEVEKRFNDIPCYFISLKPSPSRWDISDKYRHTNKLISTEIIRYKNNWRYIDVFSKMLDSSGKPEAEYFTEDGLHMNAKGYVLWKKIVTENLDDLNNH